MSESLIAFLSDIKSKMELKGLDFESDLIKLYTELRIMMSGMYDESDFGPISLSELDKTANKDELAAQRLKLSEEKKLVKTGYHRVKEKVKALRQDYRKAVTKGRRSGSGRLVCDNWDILKLLWGGSPATVSLSNSRASLKEIQYDDDIFDGVEQTEQIDFETSDTETTEARDALCMARSRKREKTGTPKFVDNKRKHLEKNLSASQRDHVFLNVAKEGLQMRQAIVQALAESADHSNQALEKISDSIASVGKSIGDGLALLAQALAGHRPPQPGPVTYNYAAQPCFEQTTPVGTYTINQMEEILIKIYKKKRLYSFIS